MVSQGEAKLAMEIIIDLERRIAWLANRLSEARILVNHDQCCRCRWISKEMCSLCWREASAQAVQRERQAP